MRLLLSVLLLCILVLVGFISMVKIDFYAFWSGGGVKRYLDFPKGACAATESRTDYGQTLHRYLIRDSV